LEYSRLLTYGTDPLDKKLLEDYYVENNALLLTEKTWEKEDDYFWTSKDYEGKESKASNLVYHFLVYQ
jgi:hypothetical protein